MEDNHWLQNRIMQHAMESNLPFPDQELDSPIDSWFARISPSYRDRAVYLHRLQPTYSLLGATPAELRLGLEPIHPLPAEDLKREVAEKIASLGLADPDFNHGLSVISRGLIDIFFPTADFFELARLPPDHSDLVLFDPYIGFIIWKDGGRKRNFWLGNQRDMAGLLRDRALAECLIKSRDDHFSLGKSLLTRLVQANLKGLYNFTLDAAQIPTVVVGSQSELESLSEDLQNACCLTPFQVEVAYRGQTIEHLLPDRQKLAAAGICPYSSLRDHSLVPSLYRAYDKYTDDLNVFRSLMLRLIDWHFYSDLLFGDPASYVNMEGMSYNPKAITGPATVSASLFFAGDSNIRAFTDFGPTSKFTVTNADGTIYDEYLKIHRPGFDSVRSGLILQHYGAPTSFIDVTRDIRIAEWFALNDLVDSSTSPGKIAKPVSHGDRDKSAIYVFLVPKDLTPIVDTHALVSPEQALRPHRQACMLLGGSGNLYRNAVSRFVALKIKFSSSFHPGSLPNEHHLFPGPDEDNALKALLKFHANSPDSLLPFPVYWLTPT